VGAAKGAKLGGSLRVFVEALDVVCKPLALPSKITVDVSGLELNQSVKVADLSLGEGVRPGLEPGVTLVSVEIAAKAGEDEEAEGGAAPAE
jgi:large subunit ribosomal protein L25